MTTETRKVYDDNGQLLVEAQILNGKLHGHAKEWYDNGILWQDHFTKNGKRYTLGYKTLSKEEIVTKALNKTAN